MDSDDKKLEFTEGDVGSVAMLEECIQDCIVDMAMAMFKHLDMFLKDEDRPPENNMWTLLVYTVFSESTNMFKEDGLLPGMKIEEFHEKFNLANSKRIYEKIVKAFNLSEDLKGFQRGVKADALIYQAWADSYLKKKEP